MDIIILVGFLLFTPVLEAQNVKIQTVVIDAGHGGKDAGAVGFAPERKKRKQKKGCKRQVEEREERRMHREGAEES